MTSRKDSTSSEDARMDAMIRLASTHPALQDLTRETLPLHTCMMKAYMRHLETQRSDALMSDPFAEAMATEAGAAIWRFCARTRDMEDAANAVVLRTHLNEALLRDRPANVRQIVFLGDGLETRAYRMKELSACHVFELHLEQAILDHKERIVSERRLAPVVKQRDAFVVDFSDAQWAHALLLRGFEPNEPTYWILEGFIAHHDRETNRRLLAVIHELSAPQSKVWTDVAGGGMLDVTSGDEDDDIVIAIHNYIGYGEDAGIFRGFPWNVELQVRRNQAGEYYGTEWDAERFARLRTNAQLNVGPFFHALFTKPDDGE